MNYKQHSKDIHNCITEIRKTIKESQKDMPEYKELLRLRELRNEVKKSWNKNKISYTRCRFIVKHLIRPRVGEQIKLLRDKKLDIKISICAKYNLNCEYVSKIMGEEFFNELKY